MPEQTAHGPVKRVYIEATVIRGSSGEYGPPGSVSTLGVISDSKWRWYDPRPRLSSWRIRKANMRRED